VQKIQRIDSRADKHTSKYSQPYQATEPDFLTKHQTRPQSGSLLYEVRIRRNSPQRSSQGIEVQTLQNGSDTLSPKTGPMLRQDQFTIAPKLLTLISAETPELMELNHQSDVSVKIDDQMNSVTNKSPKALRYKQKDPSYSNRFSHEERTPKYTFSPESKSSRDLAVLAIVNMHNLQNSRRATMLASGEYKTMQTQNSEPNNIEKTL